MLLYQWDWASMPPIVRETVKDIVFPLVNYMGRATNLTGYSCNSCKTTSWPNASRYACQKCGIRFTETGISGQRNHCPRCGESCTITTGKGCFRCREEVFEDRNLTWMCNCGKFYADEDQAEACCQPTLIQTIPMVLIVVVVVTLFALCAIVNLTDSGDSTRNKPYEPWDPGCNMKVVDPQETPSYAHRYNHYRIRGIIYRGGMYEKPYNHRP